MTQQGRWARRLGAVLLSILCLGTGQGCLSFVHSLDVPPEEQLVPASRIPASCRNHVHVFLIHGADPLDLANLNGLTEYIQALGYIKTHYGQMYHLWDFEKELRRVHKDDPDAHFVLIGFSFGANLVRELANSVKDEGILIDLLVYLGGNTLENTPPNQPDHVLRIVNILATGCIWNGAQMDRAENLNYDNVWHFGSPTHRKTREMLSRELAIVASHVPYVEKRLPPLPPQFEEAPLPRRLGSKTARKTSALSPEWTFLDSRSAYGETQPPESARPRRTNAASRVPFSALP